MSAAALKRKNDLRAVAAETKAALPDVLAQLLDFDTKASSIHHAQDLAPLDPKDCPGVELPESDPETGKKGTRIRVYDQDTFDAALELQPNTTVQSTQQPKTEDTNKPQEEIQTKKPVAVLNLASELHPGGGWQNGALAQEEALCFRSSLYLSLHPSYYPIPTLSALYSPAVVIIRDAMSRGHTLLFPSTPAAELPVTSVVTMAALRRPELDSSGHYKPQDRKITKDKIRVVLRVAANQGHRRLMLGALGCGAFRNPPEDVAQCFLEVFNEDEFQGGWWEDVVFAVLDNAKGDKGGKDGVGNFGVFYRTLDGVVV